ncbi:MAG: hypothetical protein J6Y38_03135 [Bacteroidaceae bacterium]|nr:hypothetical protein [Bacteroidaceae bacterium]
MKNVLLQFRLVLGLLILMGVGQMKAQEASSSMDERFNEKKLPYGWFAEGWMVDSTGVAKKGSASESTGFDMKQMMGGDSEFNYLMTPPLQVKEGETLVFSAVKGKASGMGSMMGGSSDSTFVVERSVYGEHKWVRVADFTKELDSLYKTFTVSNTPAGEYRFRFRAAGNVEIDSVAGFQIDMEAPDIYVIRDDKAVKYINFGVCAMDSTTQCKVINTATGTLQVNVSSDDESVFAVSPKELSIAGGDTVDVSITFLYQGGHVGKNGAQIGFSPVDERVYGSSFIADAVISEPDVWTETFNAGALPKGWSVEGWKVEDGAATVMKADDGMAGMMGGSASAFYLVTPPLTFTGADEVLVFSAKNGNSGGGMMGMGGGGSVFTVEKSVYGSNKWEKVQDFSNDVDSLYKALWVGYMEPGEYRFRFVASDSILIDSVAGFQIDNEAPDLYVTLDNAVVKHVGLGLQNADVTKTFNVTNTGTGTLHVNVSSSDERVFALSQTDLTVASGDTVKVDVTFKVDEALLGENNVLITFAPAEEALSPQMVTMQAYKTPADVWSENFEPEYVVDDESEPQELPAGWETTGWAITKPNGGGGMMAMFGMGGSDAPKTWMATTESEDYELITPRLQAQKGDVMHFLAEMTGGGMDMMAMFGGGGASSGSGLLYVYYRRELDEDWTLYDIYTQTGTVFFKAPYSGVYQLMFKGQAVCLDDFQGFHAPLQGVVLMEDNNESNNDMLEKYDKQVVNVFYDRVLSAVDNGDGTWTPKAYTLCLPFDMKFSDHQPADNIKLYKLSYIDNYYKQFIFTDVEPYAKAGEAYLAVVEQGSVSLNAYGVALNAKAIDVIVSEPVYDYEKSFFNQEQSELGSWQGQFFAMSSTDADDKQVYALGEDGSWTRFMTPDGGEPPRVNAFRAFFFANDPMGDSYEMNPARRRVAAASNKQAYRTMFRVPDESVVEEIPNLLFDADIKTDFNSATDISVIRTVDEDGTQQIFDLQGRLLESKPATGVYVVDGKKLLAR